MSILSCEFLIFMAVVLLVYYVLPLKARWMALLGGSALFIGLSGWQSAAHLGAVALVTWVGGLALGRMEPKKLAVRRILLAVLLTMDIGAMIFVKYEPAVARWINDLAGGRETLLPIWSLAAPLGLSYFTFQSAGWLIDVYRGKAKAQRNPLKAWLFVGYFPQLAQGPISTWNELGAQLLEGHRLEPVKLVSGFQLMLWGYFKKLVIADRLAATTAALMGDVSALPGWFVFGAVALYAVRLYADFSGGMDVVRGASRMLGIELPENFRRPFFSRSLAEYWRRWHITLGAWFRSYLMYPLTTSGAGVALGRAASKWLGKKTGRALPTALATVAVFLLIGVWHMANWNAAIYGLYFGVMMAASVLLDPVWKAANRTLNLPKKGWMSGLRMARTWLLVLPAQVFAFANSPAQGAALLGQTFVRWDFSGFAALTTGVMAMWDWGIVAAALLVLLFVDILCEKGFDPCAKLARAHIWVRWPLLLAMLLAILVFGVYGAGFDGTAFLYTQF